MKIKSIISLIALSAFTYHQAIGAPEIPVDNDQIWITIGSDAQREVHSAGAIYAQGQQSLLTNDQDILVYSISENKIPELSHTMHHVHNRCGGFIVHDSYEEAMAAVAGPQEMLAFNAPPIQHQDKVVPALNYITAGNIKSTISSLSGFTNRFYNTQSGQDAANWLQNHWQSIANAQPWATVEAFNHPNWGQNSVILKIEGSDNSGEILVLGGHLDSTIGNHTSEFSRAPGADDDASGIASITAVAKAMIELGEQPQRSIHIIGYAAEEVGLRGSKEIAQQYKQQGKNVVAVLQLDMTNYHGSVDDIVFMTDYVNRDFTNYMKRLITEYQPQISVGEDRCGYACSDHASWYNQGYPASMPFESTFNGANPNIHTIADTLANSDKEANNSVPFAKLGLSFAIEMGNPKAATTPTPPQAVIVANCSGLTCDFNGANSSDTDGQITNYLWQFGDNQSSSLVNPNHQYLNEGQFTVSLTVTDNQGLTGQTQKTINLSNVQLPPTAVISYSCDLLTCSFSSSQSSADVVATSWTFGDGQTSSNENPIHSYNQAGSYSVNLLVSNSAGLSHNVDQIVEVKGASNQCGNVDAWVVSKSYSNGDQVSYKQKIYQAIWWSTGAQPDIYSQVWALKGNCTGTTDPIAPVADFSYTANELAVTFTDLSSDDQSIVSYAWDFGDGKNSNQKSPSHQYLTQGSYLVRLTVTDNENLTHSKSINITVNKGGVDPICQSVEWQSTGVYLNGDKASYQGNEYMAKWWTQGVNPLDNSGPWDVWQHMGLCN